MKKLIVDDNFWQLFPDAQLNVIVAKNIDNTKANYRGVDTQELLDEASQSGKKFVEQETWTDNPVIAEWRGAYQQFKTKKGARSSIEALLKRVRDEYRFTPINPLVDLYNSVSIKYGVPLGGENLDAVDGDIHLGLAKGGEQFWPLGAEEDSPALPGELIYYDNQGAMVRSFNWREAQRTMLGEDTKNAILVMESISPNQATRAELAIENLDDLIQSAFNVDTERLLITADSPTVEF